MKRIISLSMSLLSLLLPLAGHASSASSASIPVGTYPKFLAVNQATNRVYVSNFVSNNVSVIDGDSNSVVATIPVGQLPQALVYVSNATSSDKGTANLKPLGPATSALHVDLVPPGKSGSNAHASVSINSLGLIDNLQVAATGLEPGKVYRLVLVGGAEPQDLVSFAAGIGGVAIVQTLGPLKRVDPRSRSVGARTLEVRSNEPGSGVLVLQQAGPPTVTP